METEVQSTTTTKLVTVRGIVLKRCTESGPRGGRKVLWQAADANPVWCYWYTTAAQAIRESNGSDRVAA